MRTPIPHYSPQSSRPRVYTVVALWQAHFSQLAGGHLAIALLASTLLASAGPDASALLALAAFASASPTAGGGAAEHWRQRELFDSHSRCRSGSARSAAGNWPQRQVFNSHLLFRESTVPTRINSHLLASIARSLVQQIAVAGWGVEGERSANATLITEGRTLQSNASFERCVNWKSAHAALSVNLAASVAGGENNERAARRAGFALVTNRAKQSLAESG